MTADSFIYEPYTDAYGMPVWSCRRKYAGLCGYGLTQKAALEDFLDKEDSLVPLPRYEKIPCGPFEPADEGRRIPEYREEEQ